MNRSDHAFSPVTMTGCAHNVFCALKVCWVYILLKMLEKLLVYFITLRSFWFLLSSFTFTRASSHQTWSIATVSVLENLNPRLPTLIEFNNRLCGFVKEHVFSNMQPLSPRCNMANLSLLYRFSMENIQMICILQSRLSNATNFKHPTSSVFQI